VDEHKLVTVFQTGRKIREMVDADFLRENSDYKNSRAVSKADRLVLLMAQR